MKKKTYNSLLFLLILLVLPLINASDEELFIPCGFGDAELYVGCLGDEQGVSAFWGQDFIPPVITLTLPGDGSQDTDGVVRFTFTPSEESTITSCSLVYQDGVYITSTSITNGVSNVIEVVGINFGHPLFRDDLQWRITCTDEFGNIGTSETRHLDTKEDDVGDPGGGGENLSPGPGGFPLGDRGRPLRDQIGERASRGPDLHRPG